MTSETEDLASGHGIQVVIPDFNHTFSFNEEKLKRLLLRDDIQDCPVMVLSVAGAFRGGKSFLLNFFLRYLHHKYNLGKSGDEWLGTEEEPLTGFSWRCGSEPHTSGLWLWSQPFIATLENNKKVVILLMDTQGMFGSNCTMKDSATIFALSMLLSSVQIYNLSHSIYEHDLQNLQLIMNYGSLAQQKKHTSKPFQHLQFLVRDWSWSYEHSYGAVGGEELRKKVLEVHKGQHQQLQDLRRHIDASFEDITCFLMPHPGHNVVTNPKFNGKLDGIGNDFKTCLKQLVPSLLAPENLKPKLIDGKQVTAKELFQHFRSYMQTFNGNELPEPKSILEATARASNLAAVAEGRKVYNTIMKNVCGPSRPHLNPVELQELHCRAKDYALLAFSNIKKMGSKDIENEYRQQLEKAMRQVIPPVSAKAAAAVFTHYRNTKKNL